MTGAMASPIFAQQYPQQQYPQQQYPQQQDAQRSTGYAGDPAYSGQYGNGQYPADLNNGEPAYDQGVNAPAPPPPPAYAYDRPPVPGPDYSWVDGYWNFSSGRYIWIRGYWARPPYVGAYWVAPHYSGRQYFAGFWGGGRREIVPGFIGNNYRYSGRYVAPRGVYRAPASRAYGFHGDYRAERFGNHFERGHR
jgi:hypothetical protein